MRIFFLFLLTLLVIGCCSPNEPVESVSLKFEGVLVDLDRIMIDYRGYPVRAWVKPTPGLIKIETVHLESLMGDWFIPIYITIPNSILIPEQTNINIYAKYIIIAIVRR